MATAADTITSLLNEDMSPSANRKGNFWSVQPRVLLATIFVNGDFVCIVVSDDFGVEEEVSN